MPPALWSFRRDLFYDFFNSLQSCLGVTIYTFCIWESLLIYWQKTLDGDLIPLKNNIAALRKGQLDVVRDLIGIKEIPSEFPGFEVNLKSAAIWAIRDMHLHGSVRDEVVFNLTIDGRPFLSLVSVYAFFIFTASFLFPLLFGLFYDRLTQLKVPG